MAVRPHVSRPETALRLGVLGGWLLFSLMVIAISWGGSAVRGQPMNFGGAILWNLGWLLWAGGTFGVAWLARRFPLERRALGRGLALHAGLAAGVGAGLLLGEFFFAHGLRAVWPGSPTPNAFLGFFVYKFHIYFLIYWMILGATRAYDFYTKYRESELLASQLETRLAQAQLLALKTQLHPHFLFNTHHAIVSLMLKQDNAAAIAMLTRLSDLLRITLKNTERQLAPLGAELEALDLYLGIQRERFRDRLEVRREVASGALEAEVPWLLLQPLVENAFRHGLERREANGMLWLAARVRASRLELTVRDNGPGFPADFSADGEGIGLRNTRARLARLFPGAYEFTTGNAPGGGAEVRVTLPLRAAAEARS
jgi:signal transduction histidine kinase